MHAGEFLSILFDVTLGKRLTRPFLSILYILSLVVAGFCSLTMVWRGFSHGVGPAFASFILAPLAFALYAICARVAIEVLVAVFQIAENTSALPAKVSDGETEGN